MERVPRARPTMTPRRWLVMMVKVPAAGRVKTRLARGIGTIPATSFYRHAVAGLAGRLVNQRRWTLVLAVAPSADLRSAALPLFGTRVGQPAGGLGQRMQALFDTLPNGPVLIIGSDVPDISQSAIAGAFQMLEGADAVIGPSPDGGYWTIGLRRRPRRLCPFAHVHWSTDQALEGTLLNLAGRRVAFAPAMHDIDEADDLQRYGPRGRRIIAPSG
jgi:rSAM/selenodomain-associated transferase 1